MFGGGEDKDTYLKSFILYKLEEWGWKGSDAKHVQLKKVK